jgi:hypothetical protein
MQNGTVPSVDDGMECNLRNSCIAVISISCSLGLLTCCLCFAICIRLFALENSEFALRFIAVEPQQTKVIINPIQKVVVDEDPS